MNKLNKVGFRFLTKSKALTISCISCIFFSVLVVVLMVNFFSISQKNYRQSIKEMMGGADYTVTTSDGSPISKDVIEKIQHLDGIKEVAGGYWAYTTIDGLEVYTIGAEDCEMNQHRYQYSAMIQEDKIIINEKLYEQLISDPLGATLKFGTDTMEVSEILGKDRMSKANIYFAIVSVKKLHEYWGDTDVTGKNYLMIKKQKSQSGAELYQQLSEICQDLQLQAVEEDADFQKSMQAFQVFMIALLVITFIIAGLLIASIFQSFLRKYMPDMMILKTIGGNQKQMMQIFMTVAFTITFLGCGMGLLLGLAGGNLGFHIFAKQLELSKDIIQMNYGMSVFVTGIIFLILYGCMVGSIHKFAKNLPLQVKLVGNEKKKRKQKTSILGYILSKEGKIAWKLLRPKMRSNALLLLTIFALTLFSYVSDGAMNQLVKNDTNYYSSIYLSELLVDAGDGMFSYEDVQTMEDALQPLDKHLFYMIDSYGDDSYFEKIEEEYYPSTSYADLDKVYQKKVLSMEQPDTYSAILSKVIADKIQKKKGDVCDFTYRLHGKTKKISLRIVGILETNQYGDVILDQKNTFFPMEDMHIFSPSFFLQEYTENMDQTLHQLRMQYPTLSWQSYTQVKANSAKAIRERFIMIRVMILILLVLAGAGWLIAAKNMILDRKEEYLILRKIGMTERKVSGIIWRQILPFLFIGIVLGAFAGSLLITYLGYLNYKTWNYRFSLDSIWFIVGYMIIMGMMLIPVIRKVCKLRCPHKIKHKETLREHLG